MRVSWRGTAGVVMLLSGMSGLSGLVGLVGLDGELLLVGELMWVVRKEAEAVEETRLDCFWPIFKVRRTPRICLVKFSSRSQIVLSLAGSTLPFENVNNHLKRVILLFFKGISSTS